MYTREESSEIWNELKLKMVTSLTCITAWSGTGVPGDTEGLSNNAFISATYLPYLTYRTTSCEIIVGTYLSDTDLPDLLHLGSECVELCYFIDPSTHIRDT
jgi:hypothetical protein